MLFEMLTGQHPWERYRHSDEMSLAAAIRRKEPPGALTACPEELAAIVRKMLAAQPERRYASAADVADDLKTFLASRETVAGAELRASGRATRTIADLGTSRVPVPPTVPLPPPPPVTMQRPIWRVSVGPSLGTIARAALAAIVAAFLLSEGAVWLRAERLRHRVPALDIADLPSLHDQLASMRASALFGVGLRWRLASPLTERLVALANGPILDYRGEIPVMREAQWKQAAAALDLAQDLTPRNISIRAKAKYVEGQLTRIDAQGRPARIAQSRFKAAVTLFEESARLDHTSADPYLALARIHAYDLKDFDALLQDIQAAESRGYQSGRRERAQIGDGFRTRADRERTEARTAGGDERRRLLEAAQSDYQNCVTKFTGIGGYYRSDSNLAYCQQHSDLLARELDRLDQASP